MRMTRKRKRAQARKQQMLEAGKSWLKQAVHTSLSAVLLAFTSASPAAALPSDGQITGGTGAIAQTADTMTIHQTSDKLSINWNSFTIGAQERLTFIQPSAQSIALNRVIGPEASKIYGTMTANGQVFLLNPNGVLFAPGSRVDVGGLVASTMALSDSDFYSGRYSFTTPGGGSVVNRGLIQAAQGGYVVLAGSQVDNSGTIAVTKGTAALAAGGQLLLDVPGDGKVSLEVSQPAVQAAAVNSGTLRADGGQVVMTGRASEAMLSAVVNNTGVIEARSISSQNGVIRLDGGPGGLVEVGGTVNASGQGAGETGGTITVVGDKVGVLSGATLDASGTQGGGTVLIGGNYQGKGPEQNATATYVDKNAVITADALQNGNGGQVVVWSDTVTNFHGAISAKGGNEGGNGGLVETSGKQYLNAQGSVNVAAPRGQAGTWLLDPYDVTITTAGSDSVSGSAAYAPSGNNSTINVATINTALNGGSNVIITTGSNGNQDGNITVAADILKTTGGNAALTLEAANHITIKKDISIKSASTGNKLNVNLKADKDGQYGGVITMESGSSIVTNGGNIDLYGKSVTSEQAGIQLQGITQGVTLNAGSGNITLNGSNIATTGIGVSLTGSGNKLSSTGGIISITGAAGTTGISITDGKAEINAGAGSTTLTADTMELSGKIAGTGTLTLKPLSQTTSIGVGDNASGTLKLPSAVFSSVIQSGISHVYIGTPNSSGNNGSAGTINVNNVTFKNAVTLQAPGISASPDMQGKITITGPVTGTNITLNSVQGTTTATGSGNAITADGLALLDPAKKAAYNLAASNKVNILAADTGSLSYTGTAKDGSTTVTVGTVNGTSGITLTGTGDTAITINGANLQVSKDIKTAADAQHGLKLTATDKDIIVKDSAAIEVTGSGSLALTANNGKVWLSGSTVATNGGKLKLQSKELISTGSNTIKSGSGDISLVTDTLTLDSGTTVTGTGTLYVRPLTPTRTIDIGGNIPGTSTSSLQLAASLFSGTGHVFQDNFTSLVIGSGSGEVDSAASGIINLGSGLSFLTPTLIQSPGSGGQINLTANAAIDNSIDGANQALTLVAPEITGAAGAQINAGSGLLTFTADTLTLDTAVSISGKGSVLLQPRTDAAAISVGDAAAGGLHISSSLLNTVIQPGFTDITIGRANGTGTITINNATGITNSIAFRTAGPTAESIRITGDLSAVGNTITLQTLKGAKQTGGVITADKLALRGTNAVYDLTANYNAVNTLAADAGSVAYHGHNTKVGTVDSVMLGTTSTVTGIQARRLSTSASQSGDASSGDVSLEDSGTLTVTAPITTTQDVRNDQKGDITLTADRMDFGSGASVQGGRKLILQPLTPDRSIDIGNLTAIVRTDASNYLRLSQDWFNNTIIKNGFETVTIGRENSSGNIYIDGTINFVDSTVIRTPVGTSTITLAPTAHITTTDGAGITLLGDSLDAKTGAQVSSSGDVSLVADTMTLGNGTAAGSTITGSGTLYLKPLADTEFIDLGSGYTTDPSRLQFSNDLFNGTYKVFKNFSHYEIGGGPTDTITITKTAHFDGAAALKANTLNFVDDLATPANSGKLDPTGSVYLEADTMNFNTYGKVTGSGNLQLTTHTADKTLLVGDTSTGTANLKIDNSYFTGTGRTGDKVFTGSYTGTLTFGNASIAGGVSVNNLDASILTNPANLSLQTLATGTAEIAGELSVNKNIDITAGAVKTQADAKLTSEDGDITISSHTLNLASGVKSITGKHALSLRPYYAGDSIYVGTNAASTTADLKLDNAWFYNSGSNTSGQFDNTFTSVTIGRNDGYGNITVNNATNFQTPQLTLLNPRSVGSITLTGDLSNTGTITLNAAGNTTQTGGAITTAKLELIGGDLKGKNLSKADQLLRDEWGQGSFTLTGDNHVAVLAAKQAAAVAFNNVGDLQVGTVNGTAGITASRFTGLKDGAVLTPAGGAPQTGAITISTTGALTVDNLVTADKGGAIALKGDSLTLKANVASTTPDTPTSSPTPLTGDVTLQANSLTIDSGVKVSGTGALNILPLAANGDTGVGAESGSGLQLAGSWFNGNDRRFKDGFSLIRIGNETGSGTVTTNGSVAFTDAVTLQSGADGTVALGAQGNLDNSTTKQAITLKAGTLKTASGTQLKAGAGRLTLEGNSMDFSAGGSIDSDRSGDIVIQSLDKTKGITLGKKIGENTPDIAAGDLVLDAAAFNGNVVKNSFKTLIIGRDAVPASGSQAEVTGQSGAITVNDFTVGTDLMLLSPSNGGSVTINGTLNTTGKDLTIKADGAISGTSAGSKLAVGTLNAVSAKEGIDFSPSSGDAVNIIKQLGTLTAAKAITIRNNDDLTLTGPITGNTSTAAGNVNPVTIRANGDITLQENATVTTLGNADIYLASEGGTVDSPTHFYNNNQNANALKAGSGRWLVYSFSPVETKDGKTDDNGALVRDFRRYNVTYASTSPSEVYETNSGRGFLYAYVPELTITSANRIYGNENNTIQFTYSGLLTGDTLASIGLSGNLNISTNGTIDQYSDAGSNYQINYIDGLSSAQGYQILAKENIPLTIDKRVLVLTPNQNAEKVYDGAAAMPSNADGSAIVTGILEAGSLSSKDDFAYINVDRRDNTNANVGSYNIFISDWKITRSQDKDVGKDVSSNYIIKYGTKTFTITPRPLVITPNIISKTYGDADPQFSSKSDGNTVTGQLVGGVLSRMSGENAGTYAFKLDNIYVAEGSTNVTKNYNITLSTKNFTINPREITITAQTNTKVYDGTTVAAATPKITSGELATKPGSSAKDTIVLTEEYNNEDAGKDKVLTPKITTINDGNNGKNYKVTLVTATGEITPRPIAIIAGDGSKTYGNANSTILYTNNTPFSVAQAGKPLGNDITAMDLVDGESITDVTNNFYTDSTHNTAVAEKTAAGNGYKVTSSNATFSSNTKASNYDIHYIDGSLTIKQRVLTANVTADDKFYDGQRSATVSGSLLSDNIVSGDSVTLNTATAASLFDTKDVGTDITVQITGLTLTNNNYVLSNNGQYTTTADIKARPIAVIAGDASRTYGDANDTITYESASLFSMAKNGTSLGNSLTAMDMVDGESITGVTNKFYTDSTHSTEVDSKTGAGQNYKVTSSGAVFSSNAKASNYAIYYLDGRLAIDPAKLIYKADPAARDFGMENPSVLSGSVEGFKNNETLATATTGTLRFTTGVDRSSTPGKYAILGSGLTANNGNYVFEQHPENATAFTIRPVNSELDAGKTAAKQTNPTEGTQTTGTVLPNANPPATTIEVQPDSNLFRPGGPTGASEELGDAARRWAGISIPVFLNEGTSITPEGLYNVSYSGENLTLIPSRNNVPEPPALADAGSQTTFTVTLANGSQATYNVLAANGVISIAAMDDAARTSMENPNQELRKRVVAAGLMAAVDNLSVLPDQIQAVFIRK